MQYKKYTKKILRELNQYKGEIDKLVASFSAEKAAHEKELKDMEGRFLPEFIEQSRRDWKPKTNYKGIIDFARETHREIAMSYFDKIKSELDGYFQIPVDSGFAATVTAIKSLGVTLNNREFELLQGTGGGYWGLRLLNELGVSRTKTEQRTELENGQTKRVEKEVSRPYTVTELPDIEKAYDSLQSVLNAVNTAFEGYTGEEYQLKDIIFPKDRLAEETHDKIAAEYGIEPPKQTMSAVQISKMASSIQCFDENYRSYTEFSDMMDAISATMPEPKRKEVLTDDDVKLIDTLIDSKYPALATEKAVEIARTDDRLREILVLDKRYQRAICEALALNAEECRKPHNAKEKAKELEISEKAINMAKQSAKRATEAEERGRKALEYYGSYGRKESSVQDNY